MADGSPSIPSSVQKCKMLVMTTPENFVETRAFFAKHNYFGGNQGSFIFFQQRMLPAVDSQGKILMSGLH